MPLMCLLPAPLPQVDTLSRVGAFPKLGPKLGKIVSTLGHTFAQRWDSRVTIYRSEIFLRAGSRQPCRPYSHLALSLRQWFGPQTLGIKQ